MLMNSFLLAFSLVVLFIWTGNIGAMSAASELPELNIGLIIRHTNFGVREYTKAVKNAIGGLHKSKGHQFQFLKKFNFTPHHVHLTLMQLTPTPTGNSYSFHIFILLLNTT